MVEDCKFGAGEGGQDCWLGGRGEVVEERGASDEGADVLEERGVGRGGYEFLMCRVRSPICMSRRMSFCLECMYM